MGHSPFLHSGHDFVVDALAFFLLFVLGAILIVSGFGNGITLWSIVIICWLAGSIAMVTSVKGKTHSTDSNRDSGPGQSSSPDSITTANQPLQSRDDASWIRRRQR